MIDIIERLVNEHDNISKFIDELEQACIDFMEDDIIDIAKFREYIHYIRSYADGTHHKKEEDILFKEMLDRLGKLAENLVKNGMLVEHDLARLYVLEISNALDRYENSKNVKDKICIIGNAMSYVYLLIRHIDKENGVVYPYAQKMFDKTLMDDMSKRAEIFDAELEN